MKRQFEVFADFHQFVVYDAACPYWDDLPSKWTDETVAAMFVQGEGYLAVATARDVSVPVEIRVSTSQPQTEPGAWDRIVEATLSVPSGELVVTGVMSEADLVGRMSVQPAEYRVRILYGDLDTISKDGVDGDDHYVVELWAARS
jgi:hypothetical protein